MMIPSMMPPPAPWKIFVFASGVFEMRVANFLLAVFAGRLVRWLALSLLVLKLGRARWTWWGATRWRGADGGRLAVGGFPWWWMRKKRSGSCWKARSHHINADRP